MNFFYHAWPNFQTLKIIISGKVWTLYAYDEPNDSKSLKNNTCTCAYCILHSLHAYCTACIAHCILYALHAAHTARTALHTVRTACCMLHTAYCTAYCAHCMLHTAYCILHTALHTVRPACCTPCMLHALHAARLAYCIYCTACCTNFTDCYTKNDSAMQILFLHRSFAMQNFRTKLFPVFY